MILKPKWLTKIEPGHWAAKGLVGSWIFNEGGGDLAYDSSGYGNHGTLVADTYSVPGMDGPALDFDGTGDQVTVPNTTQLTSDLSAISFVIWAKASINTADAVHYLVQCGGAGNDTYRIYWIADHEIRFGLLDGGLGDRTLLQANWLLNDQTWHQWVFTYDGAIMRMYKDTVEADTTLTQTGNINDNGHDIELGQLWQGQIGSILIYNRALATGEITSLYLDSYQMFKRAG